MADAKTKGITSSSEPISVSEDTVRTVARNFLQAIAKKAQDKLGQYPKHIQRAQWMVSTSPTGMSSKQFERQVFNASAISMMYQLEMMRSDFPAQKQLQTVVTSAGIPIQETQYGFLMPLLFRWLQLKDPLKFEKTAVSQLLDEFTQAVAEGRITTRSLDALSLLELSSGSLELQKGVCIRPVTEAELWQFGTLEQPYYVSDTIANIPSEKWNILDIQTEHARDEAPTEIRLLRDVVFVALRLISPGSLQFVSLGQQSNYGMGASGRQIFGGYRPRELGRWGGSYVITSEVGNRLKDAWPRLLKLIELEDHYLRLPAQRLLDGGGRERRDDAIIDYAIGLESLLTEGIVDELRYRFALRGATILSWESGDKQLVFEKLRSFYDVRSKIIHGGSVTQEQLKNTCSDGEMFLRDIWWWYFKQGVSQLSKATSLVESQILK